MPKPVRTNQIVFFQSYPDPLLRCVTYVKVTVAFEDISNLLVFMEMLGEEHLDLLYHENRS